MENTDIILSQIDAKIKELEEKKDASSEAIKKKEAIFAKRIQVLQYARKEFEQNVKKEE